MSSTPNKSNEEEVDLGSLFVIIGRGFKNLFNFIGNIFKAIFHFLISILLFIKKNFIKLAVAAIVGGVIGSFLEVNKKKHFGSDLLVKPNFNSTRQLYNSVNYYNDLVKQKDTVLLAKTFNISIAEASSLRNFKVEAVKNDRDIITSYDNLITAVDTLTAKSVTFSEFKYAFTEFDYKIHKVHVEAVKNDVFSKLDSAIISSITNNKYFDKLKTLNNENLNRTDSLLRNNLGQLDSLQKVYMNVLIEEAKKPNSGTSIDLGGEKKTTKELELFETSRKVNSDLEDIVKDKSEKSDVVNIISNFQPIGYKIGYISRNYIFLFAVLAVVLTILVLLLLKLNKYLSNYKPN